MFVEYHYFLKNKINLGAVCRNMVAIGSYKGPSKMSESVEARYPDILLSDLVLLVSDSEYSQSARQ